MSRRDRTLGIVLGLIAGIAAVTLFVLYGSHDSIDAASLEKGGGGRAAAPLQRHRDR